MILEGEVSMARQLDFNDVHSDAESVAPIILARECTTPQKTFSIPFCGSTYTPDCDDTMKPKIGMTFADVDLAKEFYKCYAHHVGFSVRIGQHKAIDGVVCYKRFFCAK
ncbi:hypothetical protein PVAP13_7NG238700 [Panicum virgatum]|uniref:FAR1 domain-containing protein n=1 Tax=Panicum virgatum TaxID=38727 RepID=A0A8T0Q118_PANVG|nr:hypothetical protein PVAP13_7NG238700 [Panicum virgatum]